MAGVGHGKFYPLVRLEITMNITDTCCCGAKFMVCEKLSPCATSAHEKWLKTHAPCREANMIKMACELKKIEQVHLPKKVGHIRY